MQLEADDSAAAEAAIHFMYRQYYSGPGPNLGTEDHLDFHLSVYFFADKYIIGGLREHCAKEIEKLLDHDYVCFSPRLFLHTLRSASANTPETDDILRRLLVVIGCKNLRELTKQTEFLEIAGTAGRFGAAVLKMVVGSEQIVGPRIVVPRFTCTNCWQGVSMALKMGKAYVDRYDKSSMEGWKTYCPSCGYAEKNEVWESNKKPDKTEDQITYERWLANF